MAHAVSPSDDELLRRARDGNTHAFGQLVERYEGQVAATVIGMVGPGSEADDIGQETFIRFYKAMNQFRGDAALGTYLTRIAINQSLKALKRAKRRSERYISRDDEERFLDEPATSGTAGIEQREREHEVGQALQRLDPKHRAVVVLRMLKGHSTRETAQMLDIPEGTVMSRLSRALGKLEPLLKAVR